MEQGGGQIKEDLDPEAGIPHSCRKVCPAGTAAGRRGCRTEGPLYEQLPRKMRWI